MIHSSTGAALRMTNAEVAGAWNKSTWCPGNGYIVEAQVTDKRRHTLKTSGTSDIPSRFLVIQAKVVGDVLRREYEADGSEKAPSFADKNDAKALNTAPVSELIDYNKKLISSGLIPSSATSSLHPKQNNVIEFWADLDPNLSLDFKAGDSIRLKTIGNSTIVESFTVINRLAANTFAAGGSSTLDSWTSNINKTTAVQEEDDAPAEAAADDDDWA